MTYTYTIRQPFAVTREHHELPIDPAFIKMCGLKEGLAPSEYGLAMIYLQAASYGEWVINALIDVDGNLANAVQVGSIETEYGVDRAHIPWIADQWIRDSAAWVPAGSYEIPIKDPVYAKYAMSGAILARF